MFKVNNKNTKTIVLASLLLTLNILHIFLLTLSRQMTAGHVWTCVGAIRWVCMIIIKRRIWYERKKHYFSNNQLWWKDIEIFKGWLIWQIFSSFLKNPKKKRIYCMGKQKVHISWENKLKRWWKMKNSQFRINNGLFWHNPRVN